MVLHTIGKLFSWLSIGTWSRTSWMTIGQLLERKAEFSFGLPHAKKSKNTTSFDKTNCKTIGPTVWSLQIHGAKYNTKQQFRMHSCAREVLRVQHYSNSNRTQLANCIHWAVWICRSVGLPRAASIIWSFPLSICPKWRSSVDWWPPCSAAQWFLALPFFSPWNSWRNCCHRVAAKSPMFWYADVESKCKWKNVNEINEN